jgi:dehydrogenase/reductase SDR family protein 7B
LGKELALQFAECGVAQLILSGRNVEALELVAKECQERYPKPPTSSTTSATATTLTTHVIPCDLADPLSVKKLGETALQACGSGIDILVNNGGVSSRSPFVDTKLEVDARIMQINFLAGAALAKAVVPTMISKQGGGSIIWISSVQGLIGIPGRTSYAASKFAVQGYCESLRAELASSGITVHVVSPGYIRTNLSKSALTGDGTAHGRMDETTSKGRPPKEVAVTLLNAVAKGQGDIVVAATLSAKIAIWLRFLFPSLLQRILVKRFDKERALAASTTTTTTTPSEDEAERPKID